MLIESFKPIARAQREINGKPIFDHICRRYSTPDEVAETERLRSKILHELASLSVTTDSASEEANDAK